MSTLAHRSLPALILLALWLAPLPADCRADAPPDEGEPASAPAPADSATGPRAPVRFTTVPVFVDPRGRPLAAYQLEIVDPDARTTIAGVEGGAHPAYAEPPYYDPAALRSHRVVLAAYSTAAQLPCARTRVATLHLRVAGEPEPRLTVRLELAVSSDGVEIPATISLEGVER